MKKLLFLFAFIGFAGLTAQAQCQHATAKAEAEATEVDAVEAAAQAASLDETIISRTCATSGKVSYVRKVVNAESGAVNFEDVEYCTRRAKFVSASLDEEAPAKKSCSAKAGSAGAKGAGCCAGKAKEAGAKGAGCCAGKAEGKSCAGKKGGA